MRGGFPPRGLLKDFYYSALCNLPVAVLVLDSTIVSHEAFRVRFLRREIRVSFQFAYIVAFLVNLGNDEEMSICHIAALLNRFRVLQLGRAGIRTNCASK